MSTMTLKEKIKAKLAASRGGAVSSENQPENDMVSRIKAKLAEQRASEAARREAEAEEIAPVSTFDTNKSSTGIKRGGSTQDLLAPMRESLAGFDTVKEKQAELDELKSKPRYVDDGSGGKKYIGTKAASELDNSIKALESEIEGIKDADRLKTLESYAADKTVKSSRTQQLLSGVPSMNGGDPAILGYNTLTGALKNGVVSSVNARDMTETQRHTYDVLYEQDPKLADDYQKLIESDVRARTAAREIESTKSASKEMPAVGIAANIIGGVAAPLAAADNLFAMAKGEEYDPNSAFSAGARISQASAEGLTEDIENPTLRAAANIGLGAVNYAAQLPLGSFALPMMAASSAGQTSYNARMDGASTKESAALGLIAGSTEAILEKIPLDELFDAFKGVGKAAAKEATAKSVVKAILSQTVRGAVSEGVEETLSEYVNTVADSIIRGDESEVMKYRDELITSGMSEDEANKEAFKQYYLINPAISGAGGALLGGAFRGAATAIGNRSVIAEATTKAAAAESSGIGISKRITDYPADKQKTIKEYLSSVNQGLLSFIRGVKNGTDGKLGRYNISEVTERQATDVKNVLGVDVTGYTNAINSNAVRHIEKRHGRSGEHDTSMSNPEDIARVGYVLENYDGVERLVNSEGFPEKSKEFRGSDNQPSDILRFHKKINGTQYVVEAVADNSYKKLWVVSSYIQKSKDITQESNVSPSDTNNTTSETHPASLSSDKTSIAQYEAVVKRETEKRIAAAEDESGSKLTSAEKRAIKETVRRDADKGFISVDTIEEALGGETYSKYKKAASSEEKALREYELLADIPANQLSENQRQRLEKLKPRIEDIRAKKKSAALKSRLSDEVAALAKDSRLSESYAERSRRGQVFTTDVSKYEGKQREVVQRAIDSGILNNTNRTHEFVDIIARLSADKGVSFDFVNNARLKETGFAVKDATVNGYVDKDGIKINIDSPKAWQSIVGHEVTHVLGGTELYAELQSALFDYARKRGDYEKRRDALMKLYESIEGADIDAELTADLVGDYIFTDEAFVRSLSTEHKGVFRRVYDEIKYLVKLVTAGSKEARQLERAKRVFDKVWRESGAAGGVDGVKYSLSANAKTELHKALYDTSYRNEVRLREVTPEIMLSQKDVRNLPMTMKASHIRENVFTEEEAKKLGLKVDEHTHYHGLGEDFFLQIIDSLDNVTEAYRGTKNAEKTERRENYFLLVSEFKDKNGNTINVPVYIDELANYNRVMVDVNKISTTFGRDGFRDYINKQIRLKNLVRIKNKSTQTSERYATVAQGYGMDAPNGSIPQSSENVNSKFSLSENSTDIGPVVTGGVDGVKYSISPKLSDDLDSVLNGTFNASRSEIYLGETSNFMTGTIGAESLSVTMPASKAYSAMVTEAEYEKNPRYARQDHYHGIGKDDFMEILERSEEPIAAFAAPPDEDGNDRYNRIVLVTDKIVTDAETGDEGYAVVIEEVDTQGRLNNKQIRANKAITVYPRTQIESDIDHAIADGRILAIKQKENQLFAGRRGSKPQATIRKTDLDNNIAQFWANVKWKNEKNKIYSSSAPAGMTAMQAAFLKAGYNPEGNIQSMQESENNSEAKHSLSPAGTDIAPVGDYATPMSAIRYQGGDADIAPVAEDVSDMETVQPAADASADAARPVAHARRISGKQAAGVVAALSADIAPVVDAAPLVGVDESAADEKTARTKQRSWVKTSTDSESVNGAVSPSDLDAERIHYEPISNKVTIANADKQLNNMGYENAVTYFNSQFYNRRVSLDDVALGERLIQQAIARGDTAAASELIENVAILGTELGQKVQALSIIKRNTPEGQLRMLKKVVERGKAKGDKCYDGVEITQTMSDSILDVYDVDGSYDQSELNRVVEQVKQRIADQMSVSTYEKLNAWRYLAMLGNPKTHIRNILSNVAMTATTIVKDVSARTIESIAPIGERTKTWARASDEVKAYAGETALAERDIIRGGGKYAEEASIKEKRQIFKNKVLDKVYGLNSELLTGEDWAFSKYAYRTSLQEFLTANGIRTRADIDANVKLVERGKQYALERAQAATFQQYSWLANKIGEMERKNKALGVAVGAVIPFKKTPINIAKTGLSYSPLGFAKTLTYDIVQVKAGKMEASTLVDHLAQNLTGTALTLAGYLLASAGLINGAGEDDKEGEYDYQLGKQAYSLSIGGQTFPLGWLSPVAMPLFVGANAYEQLVEGEEWNGDIVVETLAQTLDPLSEMSFLSGLNDVLSSYESGGMEKFAGIFESAAQTYVTQYVPTLLSQAAAATDDTKRTTRAAPDSNFEFFDETINKLKYKIPVLRQTLEPSIDIWGNEIKQEENLAFRVLDSFIAPSTGKNYIGTEADEELKSLYGRTDDSGVLPTVPNGTVGYGGEDYEMSAEEYTTFRQFYGKTAQELLKKLFDTETYRSIPNEEKADMVDRVYDYARDEAKRKLLAGRGVEYTNAGGEDARYYKENPVKGAIEHDMTVDEYVFMTDNPEKYEFLTENGVAYTDYADGGEEFKEAWTWAYKNPDKYTLSRAVADDLVKYRQYARAISDIVSDKDENGESISGSAKAKKAEYISGLDIEYGQKIILYRSLFDSNADRAAYDDDIVEYLINHDGISYEDKVTIFKALGFDVSDDGTVTW